MAGTAFSLVQDIREASSRVKGSSKSLDEVSQKLAGLERSLDLVRNETPLQTAAVEQQLGTVAGVAKDLHGFFDGLVAEQHNRPFLRFVHALKYGDKNDKKLQHFLDRLDRARDELVLRIAVTQVGLVGDLQNGFCVAFGVLREMNEKVKQVLGTNLALMDYLGTRSMQQTGNYRLGNVV